MVVIVDYGVGNLASISNMLKKIGVKNLISADAGSISDANKLILPGVGAFDSCASRLWDSGLLPLLEQRVIKEKVPVLGVCVGMQLLLEGSEEGSFPGLGWIKGQNVKFRRDMMPAEYKVPHMGWTDVKPLKPSRLLEGIIEPRFYFVHSYQAQLSDNNDGAIGATYGYPFVAGVEHENILGIQFHPEKSHKFGMKLLENFVEKY